MDTYEGLLKEIDSALSEDDMDLFLNLIAQLPAKIKTFELGQMFLTTACENRAIGCATLLLMDGETDFTPDVNAPSPPPGKYYPLEYAAFVADPGTIELLLYHGADPNNCGPVDAEDKHPPLLTAVEQASYRFGYYELDKISSIYQIVSLISLHCCTLVLECTELLAYKTQGTLRDLVFWVCVRRKDFLSLAVLLLLARKLLVTAIEEAYDPTSKYLTHLSVVEKEKLTRLLNAFDKCGDTIEAYVREKRLTGARSSLKEVTDKVARWLGVNPADTELRSIDKRVIFGLSEESVDRPLVVRDDDAGFAHYGTSGRRWGCYRGGKDPQLAGKFKEDGEELVGRRIMVWSPSENKYYEGAISSFDPSEKKHLVLYADGDEEMLSLRIEQWNLIDDLSPQLEQAPNHPGSAPLSKKQKKKKGKGDRGSSTNLHVGKLSRLIKH